LIEAFFISSLLVIFNFQIIGKKFSHKIFISFSRLCRTLMPIVPPCNFVIVLIILF